MSTAVLEGGDGPPVVLLQVEFAAIWMRVIPDLVATNRVIAPDLPGLGASTLIGGPPDEERVLRWLGELIDRTCASPPVLVGKGPAGALAGRFAIEAGERVSGLVLVDSHGLARFRPPLGMALTFISVLLGPPRAGWSAASGTIASRISIRCVPRWGSVTTGWPTTRSSVSARRKCGKRCAA